MQTSLFPSPDGDRTMAGDAPGVADEGAVRVAELSPEIVRAVGAISSTAEAALRVLRHPRFFRIERVHYGHMGACPVVEELDGLPCWRWEVGVCLVEQAARVEWWSGPTWEAAIVKAAEAIADAEATSAWGKP